MRVIAGTARRTNLISPDGISTRPTSDRAKESLFNVVHSYLHGASVLDLFCGSGAIGIEALSRGASHAVFVDSSRHAIDAVHHNLSKTHLNEHAHVMHAQASQAITTLTGSQFDIIFMDPPYDTGLAQATISLIAQVKILSNEGIIIVETDHKEGQTLHPPENYKIIDSRTYGRARFDIYNSN